MKYKPNPFMITPCRKQPSRRMRQPNMDQTGAALVNGMVTLGSVAILGTTTVGVVNALK